VCLAVSHAWSPWDVGAVNRARDVCLHETPAQTERNGLDGALVLSTRALR
jgi:hypothetical protein